MTVTIEYEAEERLEVPYEEIIRNVVEEALDYVECPYDAEVNVVLTDNEGIHQINLDMRGIDRPTDVLSFPMCDFETPGDFDGLEETPEEYFNPDTGELMLGDIVISVEKRFWNGGVTGDEKAWQKGNHGAGGSRSCGHSFRVRKEV